MPRSAGQSDFVVHREEPPELPEETEAKAASATATRWVLRLTILMLVLLVLLLMIGPHIPSGE